MTFAIDQGKDGCVDIGRDRRKQERLETYLSTELIFQDSTKALGDKAKIEGEIINISKAGACLITNFALSKEQSFYLSINPWEYDYIKKPLQAYKVNFNIIWQEAPLEKGYPYRYGLSFLPDSLASVLPLIEDLYQEREILAKRQWQYSHPKISNTSISLDHPLLQGLRPSALAVDVTNLCNLRCKHCFWDYSKGECRPETNKNILVAVKKALDQYPSVTNIFWYGGEPLLNAETKEIVKKGIALVKKNNVIMTNGTLPIPVWPGNVHYGVSIDGTETVHDSLRGQGSYAKVITNVKEAVKNNLRVLLLYCINAINIDCIPDFLSYWQDSGVADIFFTVYFPLKGGLAYLELNDQKREKMFCLLNDMKKKYNNFIGNSPLMIELLRPKYSKALADNCQMDIFNKKGRIYTLHMCNDGSIRVPCTFGRSACRETCGECRSVTMVAIYAARILRDKESLFSLFKAYHSKRFMEVKK